MCARRVRRVVWSVEPIGVPTSAGAAIAGPAEIAPPGGDPVPVRVPISADPEIAAPAEVGTPIGPTDQTTHRTRCPHTVRAHASARPNPSLSSPPPDPLRLSLSLSPPTPLLALQLATMTTTTTSPNSKVLCGATTATPFDLDLPVLGLIFTAIFESLAHGRESTKATTKDYHGVCFVTLVCQSWKEALLEHCPYYNMDGVIAAISAFHPYDEGVGGLEAPEKSEKALKGVSSILEASHDRARAHKGVAMAGVKVHPHLLWYFHTSMRDDRDVVFEAVSKIGFILIYSSERLQQDESIVTAAVTNNGIALQWASDELKKKKSVAMAAVASKNNPLNGMMHLSEEMRRDRDVTMEAVKYCPRSVTYSLYPNAQSDPEVMMQVVTYEGNGLVYGTWNIQSNPDIVRKAMETRPDAFEYAKGAAALDQSLLTEAVEQMASRLVSGVYMPDPMRKVREWVSRMDLPDHEAEYLVSDMQKILFPRE